MRKPRDIDAELKALHERARGLKAKRITQLGELVAATSADALDSEVLAGVLLEAVERAKSAETKEAWRRRGEGFFRRAKRDAKVTPDAQGGAGDDPAGAPADPGGDPAG